MTNINDTITVLPLPTSEVPMSPHRRKLLTRHLTDPQPIPSGPRYRYKRKRKTDRTKRSYRVVACPLCHKTITRAWGLDGFPMQGKRCKECKKIMPVIGNCPICQKKNIKLVRDHNHKTGRWRGRVCAKCNSLLGFADDDIIILKYAVQYLNIYYHAMSGTPRPPNGGAK